MSTPLVAGTQVVADGRTGVVLYDHPGQTNDFLHSVFVAFADGTFKQVPRGRLTTVSAAGKFLPGVGPGV